MSDTIGFIFKDGDRVFLCGQDAEGLFQDPLFIATNPEAYKDLKPNEAELVTYDFVAGTEATLYSFVSESCVIFSDAVAKILKTYTANTLFRTAWQVAKGEVEDAIVG